MDERETRPVRDSVEQANETLVRLGLPGDTVERPLVSLLLCALAALGAFGVPMAFSLLFASQPQMVESTESLESLQSLGRTVAVPPPNPANVVPRLRFVATRSPRLCLDPRVWSEEP